MPDPVQKALQQLQCRSEDDRQNSQAARLSMYLDDYKDKILITLKKQFHPENQKRLYPLLANYYNLLKKIVNLKAVIYKREASRKWTTGKDNREENIKYSEVIAASNIDDVMPTCNKLVEANNTGFVRGMSTEQGKVKFEAVPSENISVIQDIEDPSRFTNLLHRVTLKDSNNSITEPVKQSRDEKYTVKYFYWDEETYAVLNADKGFMPGYPIDNPYRDPITKKGIIPYVLFSNFPSIAGDIWHETQNSDLYDGTIQVNVFQTYLNNLLKQSGYRQPYITGVDQDDADKMNAQVSDSLNPFVLSDPNANVGTLELSGDLNQVMSVIHDIISEIADNHGVEFSSRTSSAQKMSGMALAISQDGLENLKEEQHPYYRRGEEELAEKTVIIANTDLKTAIPEDGSFAINFFEDDPKESTDDEIKKAEFQLRNNLISLTTIYREIDKDCPDDKEAAARIKKNQRINDEFRDMFGFNEVEETDAPETE